MDLVQESVSLLGTIREAVFLCLLWCLYNGILFSSTQTVQQTAFFWRYTYLINSSQRWWGVSSLAIGGVVAAKSSYPSGNLPSPFFPLFAPARTQALGVLSPDVRVLVTLKLPCWRELIGHTQRDGSKYASPQMFKTSLHQIGHM